MTRAIQRTSLPTLQTCLPAVLVLVLADQQEQGQHQQENTNSPTQKVYSQMYSTT